MKTITYFMIFMQLMTSNPTPAADQDTTSSQYFRHLLFRETPFSPYQGIHPIDAAQAAKTAHYRFDHDAQNRVVAVSYRIGDQLINDNGNWDSFIWFAPKVSIEYTKDQEIHRYHDTSDQRISAHGEVYQATYQLNDQGQRVALRFTDEQQQPSENAWNIHRYQWQHLNKRQLLEKRFNLADEQQPIRPEFVFHETRMTFNHLGQIKKLENLGLHGQPTNNESGAGIDRIYYDLQGNFQRWQVYDKDGKPVEGNRPGVHVGEHLYDAHGNKTGLRGFDVNGDPKTFAWGEFLITRTFDAYGNQTSSKVYDPNHQLQWHISLDYSDDGLRREWIRHHDQSGQLAASPMLGGAAALRYLYADDTLSPSGREAYDANMQVINES